MVGNGPAAVGASRTHAPSDSKSAAPNGVRPESTAVVDAGSVGTDEESVVGGEVDGDTDGWGVVDGEVLDVSSSPEHAAAIAVIPPSTRNRRRPTGES